MKMEKIDMNIKNDEKFSSIEQERAEKEKK